MATVRTSTVTTQVIHVTREEIEAILCKHFKVTAQVDWDVPGHGYVDGASLTHEVTTHGKEVKI